MTKEIKTCIIKAKKRILFVVDVEGWSYDDRAKKWKNMLSDEFEIDILYLSDYKPVGLGHGLVRLIKQFQSDSLRGAPIIANELLDSHNTSLYSYRTDRIGPVFDHGRYDGIYFFYHRALCDSRLLGTPIPMDKVGIAINNEKWVEKTASVEFSDYMRGAKVITGCNSNIINIFSKFNQNIMRVSQCVDEKVFFPIQRQVSARRPMEGRFVLGWSGSQNNPIKNLSVIKEACEESDIILSVASSLNRKELNEWYNKIDAVVCASSSEGGPLMLLEAGAVGLPVISTRVGLSREIIEDKRTGLFVEPNSESISKALKALSVDRDMRKDLGGRLHKEILARWTYRSREHEIRTALRELVS